MKKYFQIKPKTVGVLLVIHSALSKVTLGGVAGTTTATGMQDVELTKWIGYSTLIIVVLREVLYSIIKLADPEAFSTNEANH